MIKTQSDDWFQSKTNEIIKLIRLKIPIELVHFPSSGIGSAIESLAKLTEEIGFNVEIICDKNSTTSNKEIKSKIIEIENEIKITNIPKVLVVECKDTNELFQNDLDLMNILKSSRDSQRELINYFIVTNKSLENSSLKLTYDLHTHYINYFSNKLTDTFLKDYENFEIETVKKKYLSLVLTVTGGLTSINRGFIRESIFSGETLINLIKAYIEDQELMDGSNFITEKLKKISNSLHRSYIDILKEQSQDKKALEELTQMGIIDENGQCRSLLLKTFLKNHYTQATNKSEISIPNIKHIKVSDNIGIDPGTYDIYINNTKTDEYLTPNEFNVIDSLIKSKGQIVQREQIAQILWGETYNIRYSDWAIDKTISKIRTKILDEDKLIIQTRKKQGFLLL